MSLTSFLVKLLPFLYSLATRVWANLSTTQKEAAKKAVRVAQRVKELIYTSTPESIRLSIVQEFNLPPSVIDMVLTDETITGIQTTIKSNVSDLTWNQLWKQLGEQLAASFAPDHFDWKSFALGVIEIAFEKVFKK